MFEPPKRITMIAEQSRDCWSCPRRIKKGDEMIYKVGIPRAWHPGCIDKPSKRVGFSSKASRNVELSSSGNRRRTR